MNFANEIYKKYDYKKEFKFFCKQNKDNKKLKEEKAIELWEKFKPIKVEGHKWYHDEFVHIKMDQTNSRSNHGVNNSKPKLNLNSLNLNLRNDWNLISLIISTIFLLIASMVFFTLFISHKLDFLYSAIGVCAAFIFYFAFYHFETSKFWHIEKNDSDMMQIIAKWKATLKTFKWICKNSKFKNGNIRWGDFEKRINEWYKDRIIKHMDNPYEANVKKVLLTSRNFITSGGVYAWWYEDNIVYIGKANNFKRRMKEHIEGFVNNESRSEIKYNSNLDLNRIQIQLLAVTNDETEQSILESYYFEKYNEGQLLNSTGTLSWKKILSRPENRKVWERIQNKVKDNI